MKNKFFISFCINTLVGILFSFPVFSSQINSPVCNLHTNDYTIQENETGFNALFKTIGSDGFYQVNKQHIVLNKSERKNNVPGNKNNSGLSFFQPGFKKNVIDNFSPDNKYLNPTFVNLTFLKDIWTIKMLC